MHVVVLGAGVIGSLVAGSLAAAGEQGVDAPVTRTLTDLVPLAESAWRRRYPSA